VPAAGKSRRKKNGKGPTAAETLAASVARAPEPEPAVAPTPAPVPAPAEDAQADSWRVTTRQVIALLHEVERLREVRLRLEERRRDIDKALQQLDRLGIQAETAEARSVLLGIRRALGADGEEAADIVASMEDGLKSISTMPMRTVMRPRAAPR